MRWGAVIEQIRIVFFELPRLIADMVEGALAEHEDMAVVGSACTADQLLALGRPIAPDLVITGLMTAALPSACLALLSERPMVKVLGIELQAGDAHLYELRPSHVPLGEVSTEEMVGAIRQAARKLW